MVMGWDLFCGFAVVSHEIRPGTLIPVLRRGGREHTVVDSRNCLIRRRNCLIRRRNSWLQVSVRFRLFQKVCGLIGKLRRWLNSVCAHLNQAERGRVCASFERQGVQVFMT
eukprot:COSAG01_NODE_12755_length_1690_cov_3.000000_1_plen_111_part_00